MVCNRTFMTWGGGTNGTPFPGPNGEENYTWRQWGYAPLDSSQIGTFPNDYHLVQTTDFIWNEEGTSIFLQLGTIYVLKISGVVIFNDAPHQTDPCYESGDGSWWFRQNTCNWNPIPSEPSNSEWYGAPWIPEFNPEHSYSWIVIGEGKSLIFKDNGCHGTGTNDRFIIEVYSHN